MQGDQALKFLNLVVLGSGLFFYLGQFFIRHLLFFDVQIVHRFLDLFVGQFFGCLARMFLYALNIFLTELVDPKGDHATG